MFNLNTAESDEPFNHIVHKITTLATDTEVAITTCKRIPRKALADEGWLNETKQCNVPLLGGLIKMDGNGGFLKF